jgi:hypothetical protein
MRAQVEGHLVSHRRHGRTPASIHTKEGHQNSSIWADKKACYPCLYVYRDVYIYVRIYMKETYVYASVCIRWTRDRGGVETR